MARVVEEIDHDLASQTAQIDQPQRDPVSLDFAFQVPGNYCEKRG